MCKLFALFACVILFFAAVPACAGKRDVILCSAQYTGLDTLVLTETFPWADDFFEPDADTRNEPLARASMALSAAAYEAEYALAAVTGLGFEQNTITQRYYTDRSEKRNGLCAVTMAVKHIRMQGGEKELFLILVRGTVGSEWLSNFYIGSGPEHEGFSQAADRTLGAFEDYYTSLKVAGTIDDSIENNILWITGHSRGAAVTNLCARSLNRSGAYTERGQIHAFAFACPNVTMEESAESCNSNIFCYIEPGDIVCRLPPEKWGYSRYGTIIELSSRDEAAVMREGFLKRTGRAYTGMKAHKAADIVDSLMKFMPSYEAYPELLFDLFARWLAGDAPLFGTIRTNLPPADRAMIDAIWHAHSKEGYLSWMEALANGSRSP